MRGKRGEMGGQSIYVYMFHTIWEFAQSGDSVMQF